jgi:hypothetical protein
MSTVRDAFEALRQPEYTGENRCIPCTVVNVVIAALFAAATWTLVGPAAGGAVFVGCVAAIALRGYLVPGTPTLTKRYFPDRVLAWFDKRPTGATPTEGDAVDDVDVATELFAAGALTECGGDEFCLEDGFREALSTRADELGGEGALREAARKFYDVDEDADVEFDPLGPAFTVRVDGAAWGEYPSEAAFLAETAGASVLSDAHPEWDSFSLQAQSELLAGLRLFVDTCPACGGAATLGEETVESCCRDISVVAVTCEECDSRLFEVEQFGEFDFAE